MSKLAPRQRLRRILTLVSLLLFILIIMFFSPYLIVDTCPKDVIHYSFR